MAELVLAKPTGWKNTGFSLVETAMAIGLITFCLLGLVGLLTTGLTSFRECVTRNARSMAIQAVRAEIARMPFTSPGEMELIMDEEGNRLASLSDPNSFLLIKGSAWSSSGNATGMPVDPLGAGSASMRIWNVEVRWRPFNDAQKVRYSLCQADMGL